ncbi:hypothetical protein ABTX80_25025 [Streptomyces erythrochromogenes]|uniref:hypothetical protein n=1 Tax=Streptomyces erythrochromogenes TaxID=285574 RepID=UPI00332D1BFE
MSIDSRPAVGVSPEMAARIIRSRAKRRQQRAMLNALAVEAAERRSRMAAREARYERLRPLIALAVRETP